MLTWPLQVPAEHDVPLFLRLARALIGEIQRGRLTAGAKLPSSRDLARSLKINRNTVLAALDELRAQGWVHSVRAKGCFVTAQVPTVGSPRSTHARSSFGATLPRLPPHVVATSGLDNVPRGVLRLSAGTPDPRLVPVDAIGRAWRRVVRRTGRRLLEYGHPAGHLGLRTLLAQLVASSRAVPATAHHVLVTRGSQMALDLCARALIRPGDVVAVEALGYRPAWDALRLAGARLVPVPIDGEGMQVDVLRTLPRLRAVYVTPHHQYPTTVTLSPARRLQLLALARTRQTIILEDDYDHEFHYEGRPVSPLAAADDAGVVVYLGTLSKVLAPGLRLGFVVAPVELIERLVALRSVIDRQGDHATEAAVAELLEEGELQRHVRKMRVTYLARREKLVRLLRAQLSEVLAFDVPRGGISVWARWVGAPSAFGPWVAQCAARGVQLATGAQYSFSGRAPRAVRLVFARSNEQELTWAVAAMKTARQKALTMSRP